MKLSPAPQHQPPAPLPPPPAISSNHNINVGQSYEPSQLPKVGFVGFGPATTSAISRLDEKANQFYQWANQGIQIFDGAPLHKIGGGTLDGPAYCSNSVPEELVNRFQHWLQLITKTPLFQEQISPLLDQGLESISLQIIAKHQKETARLIHQTLNNTAFPKSNSHINTKIQRVDQVKNHDGSMFYLIQDQEGRKYPVKNLVLANGGKEFPQLVTQGYQNVITSAEASTVKKLKEYANILAQNPNQEIYIFGSSHSTWIWIHSVLAEFKKTSPNKEITPGAIKVVSNRGTKDIKIYYPSVEAAKANGYLDQNAQPKDYQHILDGERIHRFGGLRVKAGETAQQFLNGNLPAVELVPLSDASPTNVNQKQAITIQAYGYQDSDNVKIYSPKKELIIPWKNERGHMVVGPQGEIFTNQLRAVPQAYRLGLGSIKSAQYIKDQPARDGLLQFKEDAEQIFSHIDPKYQFAYKRH